MNVDYISRFLSKPCWTSVLVTGINIAASDPLAAPDAFPEPVPDANAHPEATAEARASPNVLIFKNREYLIENNSKIFSKLMILKKCIQSKMNI